MMECKICGDKQGPWEYAQYLSAKCVKCKKGNETCKKCDPTVINWIGSNGNALLVCEDCAKVLRKRLKNKRREK